MSVANAVVFQFICTHADIHVSELNVYRNPILTDRMKSDRE